MVLRTALALAAVLLAGACAGLPGDADADGSTAAAQSLATKHRIARELCATAGFGERTPLFVHCVAAYHAREAARLRAYARLLADSAARRQGLCLDPVRFELARCIEI